MDGGTVFWIIVLVLGIFVMAYAFIYHNKNKNNPEYSQFFSMLNHKMGLPIPQDIEIVARGYLNKIEFVYQKNKKDEILSVPIGSIILFNTFYSWQSEMQNYIARAVAGGLIAGAAGSIIGAMTTKEQQREVLFLKIQYNGEDGNVSEIILSGRNNDDAFLKKFVNDCKGMYSLKYELVE